MHATLLLWLVFPKMHFPHNWSQEPPLPGSFPWLLLPWGTRPQCFYAMWVYISPHICLLTYWLVTLPMRLWVPGSSLLLFASSSGACNSQWLCWHKSINSWWVLLIQELWKYSAGCVNERGWQHSLLTKQRSVGQPLCPYITQHTFIPNRLLSLQRWA